MYKVEKEKPNISFLKALSLEGVNSTLHTNNYILHTKEITLYTQTAHYTTHNNYSVHIQLYTAHNTLFQLSTTYYLLFLHIRAQCTLHITNYIQTQNILHTIHYPITYYALNSLSTLNDILKTFTIHFYSTFNYTLLTLLHTHNTQQIMHTHNCLLITCNYTSHTFICILNTGHFQLHHTKATATTVFSYKLHTFNYTFVSIHNTLSTTNLYFPIQLPTLQTSILYTMYTAHIKHYTIPQLLYSVCGVCFLTLHTINTYSSETQNYAPHFSESKMFF